MRKVNWLFKVSFLLVALLFTAVSCQKEDYYIDDNGNIVDVISDNNDAGEEGALTLYSIQGDNISKIKDYDVKNKYTSYQQDVAKHQEMWKYFTTLIPLEYRSYFVEFEVIHGEGELLGYVTPINTEDLSKWRMGLAIDAVGDLSKIDLATEFAYTSIHEYGHVLTLNHTQIDALTGEGACGAYHLEEGCASPNSYINELYNIGWADIAAEFKAIKNDNQAYDFYEKYKDRFVTEYAASNPAEDVAEVFAVFVTADNKPTGNTIADKKVLAMYDHPELVELRDKIRANDVIRAMVPGSWTRKACKHKHHNTPHNSSL